MPPLLVALAIMIQPWIVAADLRVGRPAAEMGQFFGDSFARRTGRPLAVVAGDQTLASLVALGAPSRPSLYLDSAPDDRPRVTAQDIADKGAVIVWPATDSAGRAAARDRGAQFPDLVVEVPRAFDAGSSRADAAVRDRLGHDPCRSAQRRDRAASHARQ